MAFYALYLLVEQNQEKEFSALISDFSNARGKNDLSTFEAKFLIESIDNYLNYLYYFTLYVRIILYDIYIYI